jgi:hypothetical protein
MKKGWAQDVAVYEQLACNARTVNSRWIISFAVISSLLCAGCIPYHFTIRPGAIGSIRDSRTGVPVAGVNVSVVPSRGNKPVGRATTDTDGTFRVLPRRQWGVYIVPTDIFPMYFTLSVQHTGYQPVVVQFTHRAMGQGTLTNFGEIRIESVAK